MNIEEGKARGVTSGNPGQPGVANYYPQPVNGYPQAGPGHPVEARRHDPLPCGCGVGWLLFILGFFLGVIPWYIGAIMLCCVKNNDKRERPGFIACAIAAVLATIVVIVAVVVSVAVASTHHN